MHDNRQYLEQATALVKEVKGFQVKAVKAA